MNKQARYTSAKDFTNAVRSAYPKQKCKCGAKTLTFDEAVLQGGVSMQGNAAEVVPQFYCDKCKEKPNETT